MTTISDLLGLGIVEENVPLAPLNTYRLGGPARWLATVRNLEDVEKLVSSGLARGLPVRVLGRGSNMVIADSGFNGLMIRLGGKFNQIEIDGSEVQAGGAVPLPRLARESVSAGLRGLEFFVGIPGSVGGAVRQNAGCFGSETGDVMLDAELVDISTGLSRTATPVSLDMGYRHSNVAVDELVLSAQFAVHPGDEQEARDLMREITRWRKDHQPGGTLNAGSVFKNPVDIPAGALIDSLGLKGLSVGEVSVSERHANFFVAGQGATAADIRGLVDVVRETVHRETGILLETEIQFVGYES